ncbi:invasion associated locus B family protein [Azospirillum oleiclasticum]|nr:invasion associated locus B family protein [Azospirillum oleiclasticum]
MPHSTIRRLAVAAAVTATVSVGAAAAADPKVLGSFKDWNAFSFEESGNTVCYASSQPKRKEPAAAKRGDIYVLITHRPAEKTFDVVSFMMGYPLKKGVDAAVTIDGKAYSLFTDGESAWARDTETDRALVQAMKAGRSMTIKGTSQRGTTTTDTYSLSGVSDAYEAMGTACNVKR